MITLHVVACFRFCYYDGAYFSRGFDNFNLRDINLTAYRFKILFRTAPGLLLAALVFLSFLGGAGISVYLNAEFGASRVGELGRWIAIICDLFKIGLSAALVSISAWHHRISVLIGITGFAILSIFSSYGYYISHIEGNRSTQVAEQKRYQALVIRQQDLKTSLKQLEHHRRPIEALEQDIRARKQDVIYRDTRRSDQCRNATIAESRLFCSELRGLEVALAAARDTLPRIRETEAALLGISQHLATIDLARVSGRIDPFALSFGDMDRVNMVFNLYLAFLLEIATTAGLPLAVLLFDRASRARNKYRNTETQNAGGVIFPISSAPEYKPSDIRVSTGLPDAIPEPADLNSFLEACVERDCESFIAITELYTLYKRWCKNHKHSDFLDRKQFADGITARGIRRTRLRIPEKGRPHVYTGLKIRPHKPD